MSENYDAVYNAVHDNFGYFNPHELVEAITGKFDISFPVAQIKEEFVIVAYEYQRPSVLFRPKLFVDGNQWCALYGEDHSGVAGFGDTPKDAMMDFDKQWREFDATKAKKPSILDMPKLEVEK